MPRVCFTNDSIKGSVSALEKALAALHLFLLAMGQSNASVRMSFGTWLYQLADIIASHLFIHERQPIPVRHNATPAYTQMFYS